MATSYINKISLLFLIQNNQIRNAYANYIKIMCNTCLHWMVKSSQIYFILPHYVLAMGFEWH